MNSRKRNLDARFRRVAESHGINLFSFSDQELLGGINSFERMHPGAQAILTTAEAMTLIHSHCVQFRELAVKNSKHRK
jgi:hypothetical protein